MKYFIRVLLVVVVLVVILGIAVLLIANKNVHAMNQCVNDTIAQISEKHTVTEVNPGEYADMTLNGVMKFHVKQYYIEDTGNVSVMTVNVGLMQMATICFTPLEKNLPLLSCDYMYILGNRKAYVELYDLVSEKDDEYMSWMEKYDAARKEYSDLQDTTASSAWYDDLLTVVTYKAAKTKNDDRLKGLLLDTVAVYLEQADAYPVMNSTDIDEKKAIVKKYSDRLIDEGGISTDFFKKALGPDVTRDFFDKVFFGTAINCQTDEK